MNLRQQFLTKNDCYRVGRTIKPKGVMIHSTGANNPRVSRYVPGDAVTGKNKYGNHWNRGDLPKCVHAFIGKFAGGEVGTVQTLPWNWRGWHAGGNANNTHIGFEICEDGLKDASYFKAVYQEAVELTAMLCRLYNLDPMKDGVVICHKEGHERGTASDHVDVLHWFPRHGKSMDNFRADVAHTMNEEEEEMDISKLSDEEVLQLAARIDQVRAKQPPSSWSEEAREWAEKNGIINGDGSSMAYKRNCTREELVQILYNMEHQ